MSQLPTVWTEQRRALLYALHGTMPRAEIAEHLGVTLSALIAHLGREYRAGKMKPPHKELSLSARLGRARRLERELGPPPAPPPKPALELDLLPVFERPPAVPRSLVWMMSTPRPRSCQFPMWGLHEKPGLNPRFCDARLVADGPYCAEHQRLTHTKRQPLAFLAWTEPRFA